MTEKLAIVVVLGLCASALSVPAVAAVDARVEGAKLCTQYIPSTERQYGIPSHLLSAISSTESGRYHERLKIVLPWPWTINAEGKGFFFNSKSEAIVAVRKMQAQGVKSIDIGCMQVNLIHHPDAFQNLEQAFEPKNNIAYAASFLRNLYETEGSWKKAAAAYHSRTPERGTQYVSRVFRAWETIISRLRLSTKDTIQQADASFDGKQLSNLPKKSPTKNITLTRDNQPAELGEQANQTIAKQQPVRMKIINVSDSSEARQNGIMVIKPDVTEEQIAKTSKPPVAVARVDSPSVAPTANSKIIRMDGSKDSGQVTLSSLSTSTKNGPRFIFSD